MQRSTQAYALPLLWVDRKTAIIPIPAYDKSMCGRFTLFAEPIAIAAFLHAPEPSFDSEPRYNIAPTQLILACRQAEDHHRELVRLRWGLIPSWAKDASIGVKAINARADTIAEKPMFRSAFKKRRCLIPASGFYEWQKTGKTTKQPFFIHPSKGDLFAFAGLWEAWNKEGEPIESCTIITTDANKKLEQLHDRMPVILPPASFESWLDPKTPAEALKELLCPLPAEQIAFHPVGASVGNVRNQDAGLIEELAD